MVEVAEKRGPCNGWCWWVKFEGRNALHGATPGRLVAAVGAPVAFLEVAGGSLVGR